MRQKRLRKWFMKWITARIGYVIIKRRAQFWWTLKATGREFIFHSTAKYFLKQKHRVYHNEEVEIFFKASSAYPNKLTLQNKYWNVSVYKHEGSSYTLQLCTDMLERYFGEVPKVISYELKFNYNPQ